MSDTNPRQSAELVRAVIASALNEYFTNEDGQEYTDEDFLPAAKDVHLALQRAGWEVAS